MNKNTKTILFVLFAAVLFLGWFVVSRPAGENTSNSSTEEKTANTNSLNANTTAEVNTNAMTDTNTTMVDTVVEDEVMVKATPDKYIDYSSATYAAESGKKRVLFFHAGWCPTCIAANKVFESRSDEIPENVVIFKTDYDTEKDLKQKYDITYQHTFVQVDSNGNEIVKWNGGDIDLLTRKVQ
ncbi:thioredoxin family protein [Candidatus Micrarchaeota archaeon]|nr:thioredoxin family protein [Candidatus Micrarchaeota archaeon]